LPWTVRRFSCPASQRNRALSPWRKRISSLLPEPPISAELRAAVRAGHATLEQKIDIVSGTEKLSPADLAELLAVLSTDPEPSIAEAALDCITTQNVASFLLAVSLTDADPRCFAYCAEHLSEYPGIADALAANIACPSEIVTQVSAHLTSDGIQALLDNLDRLSSDPELGAKLAYSEAATPEQKELLAEIETNAMLKTQEME
jgi:hypothetical protein